MNLIEVLGEKNEDKIFKCLDNNFKVRNDNGILLYLNKRFTDGTEHWERCVISRKWANAKYEYIDNI